MQDRILHINVLELKAVFLALKHFGEALKQKNVLICTDNSSVVGHLNNQGDTKSAQMVALVWRIFAWANAREVQIRARHVSWQSECYCRCPVKKGQDHSFRIVPACQGLSGNLPQVAGSSGRHVCHLPEFQVANLCQSHSRSQGLEGRCPQHSLGQSGRLCLLSSGNSPTVDTEDGNLPLPHDSGGTRVARDGLVLGPDRLVNQATTQAYTNSSNHLL